MEPLKKVGKYLFLEEQERTDLAAVWRAADLANGKIDHYYLADLISLNLTLDPGFLDHYLNQSLMVSKLEHPNILRKVKTLNESGALVSFYEYQEGFSLAAVLDRCLSDGFPFSIDHGLLVVSKLLSALAYAKSKHMTHGFVNPAVVFVTHEGEIKLKGFALSSSFRNCTNGVPDLRSVFGKYVPPGKDITDDNRDRLDIYGCGAILFEMLTGESFQDQSGDPASIIANATTAALGESIPTQIANILISSLDPSAPSAYSDIQKMAKDMDELLFSGEYSPTTFNLAFFMHSAFRNEMDELNEKLGTEKETDYSKQAITEAAPTPMPSAPPPAAAASSSAPPPPPQSAPPVQTPPVQAAPPAESGKSKTPLIIGAVAAVLVIGIGAFMMLKPKDGGSGTKFEQQAKALEEEAAKTAAAEAAKREEELRIQNEQLKALIAEQQKAEREAKRKQLEDDMRKMDEEIARIKEEEEQAKKRKQLQAELDRLKKEREEVEAKQRAAKEEAERQAKAEQEAAARREAAKKAAEAQAAAEAEQANQSDAPNTEVADAPDTTPVEAPVETVEKPNPGDIVDLELLLDAPVLLEPYKPLAVPKKAIRAGAVKKRGTALFIVKILINEDGRVEDAEVSRNPIPGDDDYGMSDKAIKAAKRLRFSRPTHLDVPIKVWTFAAIHFRDN